MSDRVFRMWTSGLPDAVLQASEHGAIAKLSAAPRRFFASLYRRRGHSFRGDSLPNPCVASVMLQPCPFDSSTPLRRPLPIAHVHPTRSIREGGPRRMLAVGMRRRVACRLPAPWTRGRIGVTPRTAGSG